MIDLKNGLFRRLFTFVLIIIAGIFTIYLDQFNSKFLILTVPGILLGLALVIPHFNFSKKQFTNLLTLPLLLCFLWIFCIVIGVLFGIANVSNTSKAGVIALGILMSIAFTIIFDIHYPIENKIVTYMLTTLLSGLSSVLISFMYPKAVMIETNIGTIFFIWEIFIGLGISFFTKFKKSRN